MITATGPLFLGKTRPLTTQAADGTFALTLLAHDRIGVHKVEPWRINFAGHQAFLFYEAHGPELQPGQPIRVQLSELRSFTNGRNGAAEIHARAERVELLPRSHQHTQESCTN